METKRRPMLQSKFIVRLSAVFVFAGLASGNGQTCYAPAVCDGGVFTETTWTDVNPSRTCQLEGEKGQKGEMADDSNVTALREDIDQLKTETDAMNTAVQDQQETIRSLNESLESLKEENQKGTAELQSLTSESAKLKLEITELNITYQDELSAFNATLHELKQVTNNNTEHIAVLKEQLSIPDCKNATRRKALLWHGTGGVFYVKRGGKIYNVYCDTATDGGGWTVFQRRVDGSEDFDRTWEEYADGFGNLSVEFWLGLENIYQLTQNGSYELRVDLTDWDGSTAYAQYETFSITERSDNFTLTVQHYNGTAGDSMAASIDGRPFTAKNRDLDTKPKINCAVKRVSAWWYKGCSPSSLNGKYNDTSSDGRGVYWRYWRNDYTYSLKGSEMKFRKK